MRPIRKTHPQANLVECVDCDGGTVVEDDWDGEAARVVVVSCSTCAGSGYLTDCDRCDEPTALTVHEINSGYCGACAAAEVLAS